MPSVRRVRRKVKKTAKPIRWGPVLGFLLVANIGLGLFLSPITSITKVRVKNSLPLEEDSIRASLKQLAGIPYALVHWGWVENRLTISGAVASIEHSGNPFGRAVITLTPAVPVASISGPEDLKGLFLSDSGRVFASDVSDGGIPSISLPKRATLKNLGLGANWESAMAAEIAAVLSENWPNRPWQVEMSEDSRFVVKQGDKVCDLGSISRIDSALPRLHETFGEPGPSTKGIEELNKREAP